MAHTVPATDTTRHTRPRKLVTKAFTTGAVGELRPFIARTTDELLDRCPAGEPLDLVARPSVPQPVIVICRLLGVPQADRPSVRRWSADLFAAAPRPSTPPRTRSPAR